MPLFNVQLKHNSIRHDIRETKDFLKHPHVTILLPGYSRTVLIISVLEFAEKESLEISANISNESSKGQRLLPYLPHKKMFFELHAGHLTILYFSLYLHQVFNK